MQCACLVEVKNNHILIVRVRDNQHWYLPGGKVEAGEAPEEALVRELEEELRVRVSRQSVSYLYTVKGPAYGMDGDVELICFSAEWQDDIQPAAEISEVRFIHISDSDKLAPAVKLLCQEHLGQH